jgi:hypothetical protein
MLVLLLAVYPPELLLRHAEAPLVEIIEPYSRNAEPLLYYIPAA